MVSEFLAICKGVFFILLLITMNRTGLKNVNATQDFVEMEKDIMSFWEKNGIEKKYLEKNKKSTKHFSFIDGPITANNPMGVHHAWGRTYKDIIQRYKNMQGFEQRFQNGFDCQGLWVEVGVEKDLGFNSKKDIQDFGLDNFTNACIARVNKFSKVQTEQSKRLGMFMDWDNSYYTMSRQNNLYIWHFLKVCNERGLLYKDRSATTWCPRCETGLSQHEQADGYEMIKDRSVFVFFKLKPSEGKDENEYILAWTTTPWTLSSNVLLAVNPELKYVKANINGKTVYLGSDGAKRLNIKEFEEINVNQLLGREYESLLDIPAQKGIEHKIVEWDLVDAKTGCGVVHIAPGCGQEDFELGMRLKSDIISPIDSTGHFTVGFGNLDGKYAHDVTEEVIDDLEKKGLLFKVEEYEHSYPHCWRCHTKCLFRLEDNWFLDVLKIKDELKEQVDTVKWNPVYVGKRMLGWLDSMGNWMISRKRFYGLALPFYECSHCKNLHVVGSIEELKELAVKPELVDKLDDIHRPWIDEIEIKCPKCGEKVKRVTDVGDCWLDAGVVPFSTLNYLENRKYWEKWYPADFITEMIEQVRLWFYSMLVFGTVLEKKVPYKEVMCFAELRDENNERMSKTKPNYVKFDDAADKVGSDILRWNFASASIGANMRFGWPTLEDVRRRFYIQLWNSYNYFVTYAQLNGWKYKDFNLDKVTNLMDRWLVSKTNKLVSDVSSSIDSYNIATASRDIEEYCKDLSQWYIRRNRTRFKEGDLYALGTLHYSLMTLSKLIAPFTPYISEVMFQNIVVNLGIESFESVHLADYPLANEQKIDEKILKDMELVRSITSNGMKIRERAKLNLRQPLCRAYVNVKDPELSQIIKEELNVKEIIFSEKQDLGENMISEGEKENQITIDCNLTSELRNEALINEFMRRYKDYRKSKGLKVGDLVTLYLKIEDSLTKKIFEEFIKNNFSVFNAKSVVINEVEEVDIEIEVMDTKIGVSIN